MAWKPVLDQTQPAELAVSLAEVKAQLRVTTASEDGLLTRLIKTATQHVEVFCGIRLVSRLVLLQGSSFSDLAKLPVGPILSIESISYYDSASNLLTVDAADFVAELAGLDPSIRPALNKVWPYALPASDAVRLEVVAGYGTAASVPAPITHAIILLVSQWYDNRSTVSELNVNQLPNSVRSLLANYRRRA